MISYFWIIFATVISLSVGFASGYWLSRKGAIADLEEFRHWFERINSGTRNIEKLLLPPDAKAPSQTRTYVSTADSPNKLIRDFQAVLDRLAKIQRALSDRGSKSVSVNQATPIVIKRREDDKFIDDIVDSTGETHFSAEVEDESYTSQLPSNNLEPYADIINLYNLGVDDRTARDRFRNEFSIIRLGNNKAIEQRLGEVDKPEFRRLDNGNFLAVPGIDGLFYVLPWFDSTLNSSAYNEGGFGHVFICPGYKPEMAYTVVRVKRPAVFQQDGDTWVPIKRGELIIQR